MDQDRQTAASLRREVKGATKVREERVAEAQEKRRRTGGKRSFGAFKRRAAGGACRALKTGFAWNPLTQYPRNKGCFCGSGKKAKACCLPICTRAMPKAEAEKIERCWDSLMTGHTKITLRTEKNYVDAVKKVTAAGIEVPEDQKTTEGEVK